MRDEVETSKLPEMSDLWRETLGWQPDAKQQEQFQRFYALVLTANQQFNLTRITEPLEFWEKHLWDSLLGIAQFLSAPSPPFNAIDIGTGAGFPGVPIAIARPDWHLTLLDSTRKKITFVQESVKTLGLENVNFWVDRVEQAGQHRQHREYYDLALIRAVASAPVCAEYTLPLLKIGGLAVLYRGQWTEEESENLAIAVEQLGGAIESSKRFLTPLTQSVRHCLYLRKIAPTPAIFPRATGIPTQTPL
ncbi:16S rRNA (guanine(527)-N(7))-methyltransferase RsmG [Phormidesmis priestleyi]